MLLLQTAKKNVGFCNTGLASVEVILLAFFGNRFHGTIFFSQQISTIAASCARHRAWFCSVQMHSIAVVTSDIRIEKSYALKSDRSKFLEHEHRSSSRVLEHKCHKG